MVRFIVNFLLAQPEPKLSSISIFSLTNSSQLSSISALWLTKSSTKVVLDQIFELNHKSSTTVQTVVELNSSWLTLPLYNNSYFI